MDEIATGQGPTPPRKRKPRDLKEPVSVKVKRHSLALDADSFKRLSVHALYLGLDKAELAASLINTHLKQFVVSDRSGTVKELDRTV